MSKRYVGGTQVYIDMILTLYTNIILDIPVLIFPWLEVHSEHPNRIIPFPTIPICLLAYFARKSLRSNAGFP